MTKLPTTIGNAWVKVTEEVPNPALSNGIILIPRSLSVEAFPLKRGMQMLLRAWLPFRHVDSTGYYKVYFTGTDYMPFLAELEPFALKVFLEEGEHAFFEALKPEPLRSYEAQFGAERTKRQGDIFAFETPYVSWKEVIEAHWKQGSEIVLKEGVEPVLGTRHLLSGKRALISVDLRSERSPALVATGVVQAPNHPALFLKTPHQILQSDLLVRARS